MHDAAYIVLYSAYNYIVLEGLLYAKKSQFSVSTPGLYDMIIWKGHSLGEEWLTNVFQYLSCDLRRFHSMRTAPPLMEGQCHLQVDIIITLQALFMYENIL